MKIFFITILSIAAVIFLYWLMPGNAYVHADNCVHGKLAVSFEYRAICPLIVK